jgi:hypothetical protein
MGQEARTTVHIHGRAEQGKALLETDELVFRGDDGVRLKVPFREMRSVEAVNGELRFESGDGHAVLELGTQAAKWAQKILHPKSLLDKLGVKAGMRVLVLGWRTRGFWWICGSERMALLLERYRLPLVLRVPQDERGGTASPLHQPMLGTMRCLWPWTGGETSISSPI